MTELNRIYFRKIWRRERRLFKRDLNNWFKALSSEERRKVVKAFYKEGLKAKLFEHEVNALLYFYFGISLFNVGRYWKTIQILNLPTWILKEIVKIGNEVGVWGYWKVSHKLFEKHKVWVSSNLVYLFLTRFDVEKTIKIKEEYDKALTRALRNVEGIHQDFILAIEENAKDLPSIYAEFAEKFKEIDLQDLFFYVNACTYYTALIDSALIDKVVEKIGLNPEFGWYHAI